MTELAKNLVRYAGMPALIAAGVWATYALLDRGLPEPLILATMGVLVFLVVWALERIVPYREEWNEDDGQKLNDVGHTLIGTLLGGKLGNVLTFTAGGAAAVWVASLTGDALWPTSAPAWLQIALVFLLADLGRYVQHRIMHEVPFLWRFHQLHHSTSVLTVFKTSRNHVVERVTQQIFLFLPMIALGAPTSVILPFVVANSFLGVLDHSNVDFRLGPLERVLMGPNAHRIHHSVDLREGNTNFGTALVVWDVLFGTYTSPASRARDGKGKIDVGIAQDDTPASFVAQITDPFRVRS